MDINRRDFFKLAGAAAVAGVGNFTITEAAHNKSIKLTTKKPAFPAIH